MVLPKHDRELSLWLVKECIEDFQEMGLKMQDIAIGAQRYSIEKERLLDEQFGSNETQEGRRKRIEIERLLTHDIQKASKDVIEKLVQFNPAFFAQFAYSARIKDSMR